jgi:hypothetical protein
MVLATATTIRSAVLLHLSSFTRQRWRACMLHLGFSAMVAVVAALVVFAVWYPPPFGSVAGGTSLFALLIGVDLVMGPALTAVVASPGKPIEILRRDIATIVIVQLAAFSYGIYSAALARPVAVVFEADLFRVVTAADVDDSTLQRAPPALRTLSWTGPVVIAVEKPKDAAEQLRTIELGLAGIPLSSLPLHWKEYAEVTKEVLDASRPVSRLVARHPSAKTALEQLAASAARPLSTLRCLPLVSRQAEWSVVLDGQDARVIGYVSFNGFDI